MRRNILNLAYAKAFNLVPLCSPLIFLYSLLFCQRTTSELHRQSFQMNSPSHLKHYRNQQQFSHTLVQHNKFYEYSTVKVNNGALNTESLDNIAVIFAYSGLISY